MKLISTLIILLSFFNSCGPVLDIPDKVSEKAARDNFLTRNKEIYELKNFYNSITPKDMNVQIEFISDTLIDLEIINIANPKYPIKLFFAQSNINPYNYKPETSSNDSSKYTATTESLEISKSQIGWTNETFKTIKKYLDKSNCISITNGEPANIGFKRSGFGIYFYNMYNNPIDSNLKTKYHDDSCKYRILNDTLILEYRNGVYGPNCIQDK